MGRIIKWLFLGFLGLAGVGMIVDANKTPEQRAAEAAQRKQADEARAAERAKERQAAAERERAEIAKMPTVSASDLARAYEANTVAADRAFKGARFKVTGVVGDINTDLFGKPYVTLRGGVNEFMEPQFGFDKDDTDRLATLRKGSKVTLVCTGAGDVAKTPMSRDCRLL